MSFRIKNFCLGFRHTLKEYFYRLKYLSWSSSWEDVDPSEWESGIAMIDGTMYHGGICDRFKGMISFYNYCRYVGKPFRIRYNFPFELTDYIVPNKYDWRISDKDISKSIWHVRPICMRGEKGKRLLKIKTNKQIRFYSNSNLENYLHFPPFNDDWGETFNYLFKPSPLLQMHLDKHREAIGGEYVAAVFRFQNLFGDFKEYRYRTNANPEYRERMMKATIEELEEIHRQNPDKKILVTADSSTFLEQISQLDFVYAIQGKQSHVDTKNASQTNSIKAFIDFYMIAGATKVYGVTIDKMYNSHFPICAAKVGNVPFIRIVKKLDSQ